MSAEIKPVVLVKVEFEYREKLKLGRFLWKFWIFRILMQEKKMMTFQLETRPQVLCSRLRFYRRKSKLWWLTIKSSNIELNLNKKHFLEYLDCHESDGSKQKVF